MKYWLTSRTVCELHIIRGTCIYKSTTRTTRTGRETMAYGFVNCISLEGLGVYIQVHDLYDLYDSYGS